MARLVDGYEIDSQAFVMAADDLSKADNLERILYYEQTGSRRTQIVMVAGDYECK